MSPLLDVRALAKTYPLAGGQSFQAVDGVSFALGRGETLGLVGESGCGKSTLSRLVSRLIDPTAGEILFEGEDVAKVPAARFARHPRRGAIQVVFQDPLESLNPHFRALDSIAEPLRRLARIGDRHEIAERAREAARLSGLSEDLLGRYPHQLSGGQRARVGIARAVVIEPKLLILDEPTSALDVSVQAVILRLLDDLRARLGLAFLFVSHDLNVVRLLCHRVMVMNRGRIVEEASAEEIFRAPQHDYTRALLASMPDPARNRAFAAA